MLDRTSYQIEIIAINGTEEIYKKDIKISNFFKLDLDEEVVINELKFLAILIMMYFLINF